MDKSYPGDNRLVLPKSSYRRQGSAPRCRLVASWRGNTFQGLGCSPIKAARELGSKRREPVWSLSGVGVRRLKSALPLVRKDRGGLASSAPIVTPVASLGSYANN
jgi:hypothetical protein